MKPNASPRMHPLIAVLRFVLVFGLLAPQLLPPNQLGRASAAASPFSIEAELASLRQAPGEDVEIYLQRMAVAQPELFQQAAMAALQDALNGALPQQAGEQAIEYQMAFYIDQAVQEAMRPETTWLNSLGANLADDAPTLADWGWDEPALTYNQMRLTEEGYQWQSSAFDTATQSVAGWQMNVTPSSDPALFAQEFEALLNNGQGQGPGIEEAHADLSLANDAALTPLGPVPQQVLPLVMPELPAEVAVVTSQPEPLDQPEDVSMGRLDPWATAEQRESSSDNPSRSLALALQTAALNTLAAPNAATAPNAIAVSEDTLYADLQLSATAPPTVTFDTVITYTLVITNAGPANASNVRVVQNLPANGLFEAAIAGCAADNKVLTCNTGALNANAARTLNIPVKMKGHGDLPSVITVSDSAGTVDPDTANNTVTVTTTVSSPSRTTQTFNNVIVAANSFTTELGKVTAEGAVFLGLSAAPSDFFIKLGPDDTISWELFGGNTAMTAEGATVGHIVADTDLFKGNFTIDSTADKPVITPVTPPDIEILYENVGAFDVVDDTRQLSNVTLEKGYAAITVTIQMSQPGITTTTQVVGGVIKPGPLFEGTVKNFNFNLGSVNIVANNTVVTEKEITVANAEMRLPDSLGGLTGVIANLKLTKDSINFGGAGVKIPFPDITLYSTVITSTTPITPAAWIDTDLELLHTAPLTATGPTTATNSLKLVQNSATIGLFEGVYTISLEGKMEIQFPDNKQTVKINFTINEKGLVGKVDKIIFKVAGYDLELKGAELKDGQLTVKEATLKLPPPKAAPKDGKPQPARASRALNGSEDTPPPTSFRLENIILKDVSISKDGLKIGGGGGKFGVRDFKFGETVTLTKLFATIEYTDSDQSYEFSLEGVMAINLDVVSQPITFTAKVDKDGKLSGTIEKIELTIAQTKLELDGVTISERGFESDTAKLTLPPILGSREVNVAKVVINSNGISFGDVSVKIPIEFTIGDPESSTNIAVKGDLGLDVTEDKKLVFRVEGTVTLKVVGQTVEAKGKVSWDKSEGVKGELEEFTLTIAGLKLGIKDATIEDGVWKAKEATLQIPEEWGGLSATIYHVEAGNGEFKMGGGEFQLPEITVADMKLTVKGKLVREGQGYVIAATGSFKMPNMGGAGCSGLKIGVEIYAGPSGQVIMDITPQNEETPSISAVQLREVTVGLNCTIPVGTSGFNLTEVSGTLTLQSNTTKIDIRVKMESDLRVGPFTALTADGNMGIEYTRNPNKFEVNIGAAMTVFSMFQAAEAQAMMRLTEGADVPFLFKAEMNINALIARGNVQLAAWTDKGDFSLVGRVYGQIGMRKGALLDQCISLPVIVGFSWWGLPRFEWRPVCLSIPPTDLFISANMEFGKFQTQTATAWGFKAEVEILGKRFGVYVDTAGSLSVGNVSHYQTVTIPTMQRARFLHEQLESGALTRAALSAEDTRLVNTIHFADTGEVYIDIVDLQEASDLALFFLRSPLDPDVQVTLIRPDGYEITPANLPSNATWTETLLAPDDNGGEPVLVPATQIDLSMKDAEEGFWRAKLSRQPNYDFLVDVIGLSRGPAVSDLYITEQDFDNETITLEWLQTEGLTSTVTIYATQDAITTTASYTDTQLTRGADGLMVTEVITVDLGTVTRFEGIPLAVFENVACLDYARCKEPPDSRQLRLAEEEGMVEIIQEVDVSGLRSGVYRLWLEVDDGEAHPSRTYFPGTVTVARFADPDAPDTWTSNVTAEPSFGALELSWDAHPNPDVHWYEVEMIARSIGSEDIYRIPVGGALGEVIEGLPANQTYEVTIWTYDTASSIYQASEAISTTIPPAPYAFTADPGTISVIAGESATGSLIIASEVSPYPETVVIFVDKEPLYINVDVAATIITPTVSGATTTVTVSVSEFVPTGTYTATLAAVSSSGEEILHLPIHVQRGQIQLTSDQASLTLNANGATSAQLTAAYDVGSGEDVYLELIDFPAGLDWQFSDTLVDPGVPATLTISDTQFLPHGVYTLTILADDGYRESILNLPLTVNKPGFELLGERNNRTALPGETVTYTIDLETTDWPHGVVVAFDPDSLIGRFTAEVTSEPLPTAVRALMVTGPAQITAVVTINEDTPVGVYQLGMVGTSNGISNTLPLYLTVFDEPIYGDVNITRTPIEDAWAGLTYSYTLIVQNAGPIASTAVSITEQVDAEYLSLVDGDGCAYDPNDGLLTCFLGDIDPLEEVYVTITWELAEDTPDGIDLTHIARVGATNEISEYDNTAYDEAFVERFANLFIDLDSSPVTAGLPFTYTVTVVNFGPAYDEDVVVELYLPWEAWVEAAPVECDYDNFGVLFCELGAMAPGEMVVFDLEAYVEEDAWEFIETIILVYGDSIDWDLDDNALLLESPVESVANLSLAIIPDRTDIDEGETVVYTVLLTNEGPSLAGDIEMIIEYPDLADIVDIQINDVPNDGQSLSLGAHETLTVTIVMRFMEDDDGIPFEIVLYASADNAPEIWAENTDVRVSNTPPVITIPAVIEIEEGGYDILTANVVDAGGRFDPLTITWDLNNNGQFTDGYGATALFDALDIAGPATRIVRVRAEDDDGGVSEQELVVQIRNVAPMVFVGPPQRLLYDATFTFNPYFFDPSPSDTHTARVEWGDGNVSTLNIPAQADEFTVQHTYNQVGNFEVNVCVQDNSGAEGCDQVMAYAACQEHGLRVDIQRQGNNVLLNLHNASGNVTIPADFPFTLYNHDDRLQTLRLGQSLAVGQSQTLTYSWPNGFPDGFWLGVAVDEDEAGNKTTPLCSGMVRFGGSLPSHNLYLPFVSTSP